MNTKNILISIAVFVIGIILYKFLLGFVLPIALFVSLGYVLKFLLKGAETDSEEEFSQILMKSETSSSKDNIVEIKPIQEAKPTEGTQPTAKAKPTEGTQSTVKAKPTEGTQPTVKAKSTEGVKLSEEGNFE